MWGDYMKKDIEINFKIEDEDKTQKLMAQALADITRMRIEKLPEHLRVKSYDILIEKVKAKI